MIEIVILWIYYTIPSGFSLIWNFLVITFQLFRLHVWLRITDEGSVPYMISTAYDPYRKFDPIKNGVYNLVEVSVLNFNYLVSVTAGGPVSPRGHM